jgi:patatin-like phospholipase/acyl hydrolase
VATPLRVLSIDGGGIRGIIPALVLAELERRTRRPTAQLFDLVAGTSTGGILALALVAPKPDGEPAYSAADLVGLYEHEGAAIFATSVWLRIPILRTLLELLGTKYPARNIEQVLRRFFGEVRLSQALVPVLVTGYELEKRDPWFFRSERAKTRRGYDFPMRDVARATSAAPTYFPPFGIRGPRQEPAWALVDGGVYANNPAMCAYVEARSSHPDATDILVVTLGTGQTARPIAYRQAKRWGIAGWARPLLSVVFDGESDVVEYQLERLLEPGPGAPRRHYRFQVALDQGESAIDDASPGHIERLKALAQRVIADNDAALTALTAVLTSPP